MVAGGLVKRIFDETRVSSYFRKELLREIWWKSNRFEFFLRSWLIRNLSLFVTFRFRNHRFESFLWYLGKNITDSSLFDSLWIQNNRLKTFWDILDQNQPIVVHLRILFIQSRWHAQKRPFSAFPTENAFKKCIINTLKISSY